VTTQESSWVSVARILRPHGRRGEVACEILTDFPDRLKRLTSVELCDGHAELRQARQVSVLSCWLSAAHGQQAIFHFEGSHSISDAEKLVGLEVQIPIAERRQLPSGTYYVTDLVGCQVVDRSGSAVGLVHNVQFTGEGVAGTPILVLDSPKGELLIPLAQEICVSIDVAARRIEVVPPEGLLDLNQNA
jgi:16S rRNA processing protein RimM